MLNTACLKRINKELERDFKHLEYSCTLYHPNKRYIEVQITMDGKILQFNIGFEYPFKAPTLYVNEVNYIYQYKQIYLKYKDLINTKKIGLHCPCCDTILCDWSPGNYLYQILEEHLIRERKYNKLKMMLRLNIVKSQLPFDSLIYDTILNYTY